ncbi:vacuolar membrane protein-domain-containing protein [Gongronella butleri]|nr:vacuolar membrane protein-domain-containing protein [Gongronella butleri]
MFQLRSFFFSGSIHFFFVHFFHSFFLFLLFMLSRLAYRFAGFDESTCFDAAGGPPADDEGCKLLDGFAIVVQILLASSAFGVLVFKRYRERPQRPVDIWALDVSKQFLGGAVVHAGNLLVSYLVGRPKHGAPSNLCVWYLLNVFLDCTIGVGILWCWLRALQWVLETQLHITYVRSGKYGPGPLHRRLKPWLKQTFIFILAEALMKTCVYTMLRLFPVLFRIGNWALEWTKGNYRYQVIFVMLIFPLLLNGMQFWIVDTIVKMTPVHPGTESLPSHHDSATAAAEEQRDVDENTPLIGSR